MRRRTSKTTMVRVTSLRSEKMKKKMLAVLVAAMMSMMFIMPMASAFAADPIDGPGNYSGDSTTPASIDISKTLQVAVGQDTPGVTFSFAITPKYIDGVAYAAGSPGNMPVVSNRSITYSASDSTGSVVNGFRPVTKSFEDVFQGVSWPHGGIYEYEITEVNGGASGVTYSGAKYRVEVYVDEDTTGFYAKFIVVCKTTNDKGLAITEIKNPVEFENSYTKANAGTLIITKAVSGAYANTETYFNFTINLDSSSGAATTLGADYKAYLTNADGTKATPVPTSGWTQESSGAMNGYWYKLVFAPETPTAFTLKHGEYLRVVDLPYGTKYVVSEITPTTYVPSYSIDGDTPVEGYMDTTLTTSTEEITDPSHQVDFVNDRSVEPPTGLDFNDLPFVGLMILAAGLFAALVAVKVRKATRQRKNFGV
jgi:pilin isopeptide linkage protein